MIATSMSTYDRWLKTVEVLLAKKFTVMVLYLGMHAWRAGRFPFQLKFNIIAHNQLLCTRVSTMYVQYVQYVLMTLYF